MTVAWSVLSFGMVLLIGVLYGPPAAWLVLVAEVCAYALAVVDEGKVRRRGR